MTSTPAAFFISEDGRSLSRVLLGSVEIEAFVRFELSFVLAVPESGAKNAFKVKDLVEIPLYDGRLATTAAMTPKWLRFIATVRIASHSIKHDIGPRSFGGENAESTRAAMYRITGPGVGTLNVLLKLPHLAEHCVSCRTVHFYLSGHA